MRHLYDCPLCGTSFSVVQLAGLTPGEGHPKVCPNGHKVTKLLKQERRRRQVQRAAEAQGLAETQYRARRRLRSEGGRDSLLLWDYATALLYPLLRGPQ